MILRSKRSCERRETRMMTATERSMMKVRKGKSCPSVSLYMGNGMMAGILIRGSPARIRSRNPVDINRQGMRGTRWTQQARHERHTESEPRDHCMVCMKL
jgi:hypothetical protein